MKEVKGRTVTIVSTVAFLLVYFISSNMYSSSKSVLFLYLYIISLLFASTNLLLIFVRRVGTKPVKKKSSKTKRGETLRAARAAKKTTVPAETADVENTPVEQSKPEKDVFELIKKKFNFLGVLGKVSRQTWLRILCFFIYGCIVFSSINNVYYSVQTLEAENKLSTGAAVTALIVFAFLVVLDKFCKHAKASSDFVEAMLKNSRLFIRLLSFQLVFTVICAMICASGILNIHKYAAYLMIAFFVYCLLFIILSLVITVIKKEFEKPYIKVVIPFSKENRGFEFVEFLETNTGITMRSLWSVKYIKKIAPITALLFVVILWLTTSVVQVGPQQQAAVYRLGALRDKVLEPGLHFVLPYPFDKAEIYDTQTVQKMTIGYKSSEPSDNIWTSSHGSDEYKLLLGNGDELVSINLRLEYKISDLKAYLSNASSPELILEALAYELVTDKTIETDLATLLSADRDAFAQSFKKELDEKIAKRNTGLEVVCVILESIHPPVEISAVYQQIISAEITAEKYILDAEAQANVKVADAQAQYDTAVNTANAENAEKVAAAKTSVAEFTASLQAYNKFGNAYKYQKYLGAVREAYGKANLVILSEDVDSSAIYFGNISNGTLLTPGAESQTQAPETEQTPSAEQ